MVNVKPQVLTIQHEWKESTVLSYAFRLELLRVSYSKYQNRGGTKWTRIQGKFSFHRFSIVFTSFHLQRPRTPQPSSKPSLSHRLKGWISPMKKSYKPIPSGNASSTDQVSDIGSWRLHITNPTSACYSWRKRRPTFAFAPVHCRRRRARYPRPYSCGHTTRSCKGCRFWHGDHFWPSPKGRVDNQRCWQPD